MTNTTAPRWKWQSGNLWHLVAADVARDETYVLATAASTYWHISGTSLDGAARDCDDARRRAVRALLRSGLLAELPEEPVGTVLRLDRSGLG